MAIGHLYTERSGWTIMDLGKATPDNYRRAKNLARYALSKTDKKAKDIRGIITSMISECEYVEEWLETGRRPGSFKGAERAYKELSWDPNWIESYASPNGWYMDRTQFSGELSPNQRFRIEEAMCTLSDREKQCFMLYYVDGMSEYDIARELQLGRTTVQDYLQNAKRKIENEKLTNLFLAE
ncbi:LuxR C-terminal-related transcriptional regulator [Paenibacillus sp. HWE-109]|uniref:sigma factor-like helix-turn-helix DNA-binding protein n=1 Tax=Paenibacillus sp. HWE-109 TaxID=1306526 RepID=UPI001EDC9CC3|nr:sigma factor-like helix-turn-helix DNA-binding protein [Paenibacillus sp. HWE-109]UKS27192.1 LuxR C-terminal-related transcriptional regulator [Paenibacillus sp. HWE-109]